MKVACQPFKYRCGTGTATGMKKQLRFVFTENLGKRGYFLFHGLIVVFFYRHYFEKSVILFVMRANCLSISSFKASPSVIAETLLSMGREHIISAST